ncbi:MAG: zf-HC2 domain-containing protein [Eubacteriaceae bacterium]|nr:zf-HC2 domain-containing protein [Eubacteriaceae bacterium]
MNKFCNIIRDILPLYVEKMLSSDTEEFVNNHLMECEECRESLREIQDQEIAPEKTHEDEIKPLTELKKKVRLRNILIGIISSVCTLFLGFGIFFPTITINNTDYSVVFLGLLLAVMFFGLQLIFCIKAQKTWMKFVPLYTILIGFAGCGAMAVYRPYEGSIIGLVLAVVLIIAALGECVAWIVYGFIHRIGAPEDKHESGRKWGLRIAAVSIVLVIAVNVFYSSGLYFNLTSGCGQKQHDITAVGHKIYFVEGEDVFVYDIVTKKKDSHPFRGGAEFVETSMGVYMTGYGYMIYPVSEDAGKGFSLQDFISSDEYNLEIIDIFEDSVYWKVTSSKGGHFLRKVYSARYYENPKDPVDVIVDNVRLIHTTENTIFFDEKIMNGKLYYYDTSGFGYVRTVDIESGGEDIVLRGESETEFLEKAIFYDDFILIQMTDGMYRLNYGEKDMARLNASKPVTAAMDRVGDKLYYVIYRQTNKGTRAKVLTSYDLTKGKTTDIVRLSENNGIGHDISEAEITPHGFYFTDPDESKKGGVYYYNYDTEKVTRIHR